MSGVAGLRGVSAAQDGRFSDKTKQLQQQLKFPKQLDTKINFDKVNLEVIREWVAKRVTALLNGLEDDVLIGFIFEMLEQKAKLDPRELQIYLTGFLEKNTSLFMKELWTLLIEAQQNEHGIPQQLLDLKAEELRQKQKYQEKIKAQLDRSKTLNQDAHTSLESKRSGEERRGREPHRQKEAVRSRSRERDGNKRRYRSPPQFYRARKEERYRESYYRPRPSRHSPSPSNKRYPRESPPRYRSKSPSPIKRQPRSVSPRYKRKSPSPRIRQSWSHSRSRSPSSLSPLPSPKPRMQRNNEQKHREKQQNNSFDKEKGGSQHQQKSSKDDIERRIGPRTSPDPMKEKVQASMSPFNETSRPLHEGAPSPSTDKDPSQQKRPKVDWEEGKAQEVPRQKRQRSSSRDRKRKKEEKSLKKKHKKDKKSKSKKKRDRYDDDEDGGRRREKDYDSQRSSSREKSKSKKKRDRYDDGEDGGRRREKDYDSQRSSSREKVGDVHRDINDIVQEMKSIVEVEDLQALRQKALRGMRDEN